MLTRPLLRNGFLDTLNTFHGQKFRLDDITLQYRIQDSISKISQHLGDADEEMAPFYNNPMTSLKSLTLELAENWNSESFKDILDCFPCLETLTISQQSGFFNLPVQDLISVLISMGDVKNLSLSNFKIKLTGLESYDATMDSNIFQVAVNIIDKFPVETTQIKILGKRPPYETPVIVIIKEKGIQSFMKLL